MGSKYPICFSPPSECSSDDIVLFIPHLLYLVQFTSELHNPLMVLKSSKSSQQMIKAIYLEYFRNKITKINSQLARGGLQKGIVLPHRFFALIARKRYFTPKKGYFYCLYKDEISFFRNCLFSESIAVLIYKLLFRQISKYIQLCKMPFLQHPSFIGDCKLFALAFNVFLRGTF